MSTQRSVRFPDDVFAALVAEAERTDRSFSYVVARTCGERFVLKANPFSVVQREARRSEERALESSEGALPEGSPRPAPPRASKPEVPPKFQAMGYVQATQHHPTCRCPVCKPGGTR